MQARRVMKILQESFRLNGGDLSSSSESPPIARGNPTAGSSSQVSPPKQALQERTAELQEKVQGIQGQIDEVAVLKEQIKLMQEQIDEAFRLKEKTTLMQRQIDDFVENFKRMQDQIDMLSAGNSQQPWNGQWYQGWSQD